MDSAEGTQFCTAENTVSVNEEQDKLSQLRSPRGRPRKNKNDKSSSKFKKSPKSISTRSQTVKRVLRSRSKRRSRQYSE